MAIADEYWTRPFPMRGLFDPQACAERRLRTWLHRYPQLVSACFLGCKLEASPGGGGSSGSAGEAGFAELVCIKADIDLAMLTLPPRSRIVMALHYHEGLLQREIAELMRCNQSTISRILSSACIRMASHFVIVGEDEHESAAETTDGV